LPVANTTTQLIRYIDDLAGVENGEGEGETIAFAFDGARV